MSFEEWFNENYGDMVFSSFKSVLKSVWQAARPQWISPVKSLPKHEGDCNVDNVHIDCLVAKNGVVLIRPWNTIMQCWDTEDYDDYYCDATEVEGWMLLPRPMEKSNDFYTHR